MEAKTVVRDKSLRDIWTATDKRTIDILQDTGELSQNNYSPNKATPLVQQNNYPSWSQAERNGSYFNSLEKDNLKGEQGLFQPDTCKFEDDNVSLYSIWAPTNNDNLQNELKSFHENPLIDLDISENSNPKQTIAYTLPTNSSCDTFESPLIDLDVPKDSNANMYASPKNYNYESRLIDLELSGNSYPKQRNKCSLPEDYTYRNISSYSGSKLNNDNNSEKSLDELNEETFGEFSAVPNEVELTLSDISEATAAYKLNEDQSPQKISKAPKVFEYSETTKDVQEVQAATTGTKPKTYITKVYRQNNIEQYYPRKSEERNSNYKREFKRQNASNLTNIKPSSDEILNLSHENLTICKARPLRGSFRRNSANNERRRVTTHSRQTFHSKVFSNEQTGVATHTRETFHKRGNMSYYTADKITYVRGEKLENTYKKRHKDKENNIVWRNICEFGNDREIKRNFDTKIKKYFRDDSVPHHYDIGKKLPNFDMKTNYEKYQPDADNSYRFTNQNNSKMHDLKQSNYLDQRKTSKNDVSQDEKFTFKDETTAQCIWQSSINKSNKPNFDELDNSPREKTSGFRNIHNQKIDDIEHNNKKNNVIHFKVYDPKLRRPTKQKIIINQYPEHMKFKSSLFNNPQTEKSEVPYAASGGSVNNASGGSVNNASGGSVNKDSREQFGSKIVADKYAEHMKVKNNSFDNPQNKKTEIPYTAPGGSMNKGVRDHFEFLENINLNKADKESKTFVKDVLCDIKLVNSNGTSKIPGRLQNSTVSIKNDAKKDLKSSLIRDGKEIADLIVGCQRALDIFKSFYCEWIDLRKQSISLLEQIVMIINQSSRKNDTMKHVIAAINIAAGAANFIPHTGVALGARVAGAVGGFLANIFNRTDCEKDVNAKKFEIKEIFQKDIDSSSYVYIYGVQCGSQFQETCNAISKFYNQLLEKNYLSIIDNEELLEFLNEITEYNSRNTLLFYKRLRMCYERLIISSNSVDSRAFVRVIEDVPDAITVIDLLPWKFDSDGFDNSIVENAWDELLLLFQDGNLATVDIIKNKIQDCLFFLKKEHRILSRNVTGLLKETFK